MTSGTGYSASLRRDRTCP